MCSDVFCILISKICDPHTGKVNKRDIKAGRKKRSGQGGEGRSRGARMCQSRGGGRGMDIYVEKIMHFSQFCIRDIGKAHWYIA